MSKPQDKGQCSGGFLWPSAQHSAGCGNEHHWAHWWIHHSICLFLSQTLSFVYTSSFHYSFSRENSKSLGLFSPIPTTQGETLGKVNIAMLTNSLPSHLCSPGTLFKGTRHEWGPETSSWVPFVHMVTGLWTKLLILWAGDSQSLLCRTR